MPNTDLLINEIKTLPASSIIKIFQFMEQLKQENINEKIELPPVYSPADALIISKKKNSVPCSNSISSYIGRLKNSQAFAGNPVVIQRQMRAEWE